MRQKIDCSNYVAEGGWSPEAVNRAETIHFFLYDIRTKKVVPIIGIDAVDAVPSQTQIKFQENLQTGEMTILDRGDKVFFMPLELAR